MAEGSQEALKDFGIISQDTRMGKANPGKSFVQSTLSVLDDDTMHSVGLYSKEEIKSTRIDKFARFGRPLNVPGRLNPGREYLFFVKPDLHICVPIDSITSEMNNKLYKNPTSPEDSARINLTNSAAQKTTSEDGSIFKTSHPDPEHPTRKASTGQAWRVMREGQSVYNFTSFELNSEPTEFTRIGDLIFNPQMQSNGYFKNLVRSHPEVVKQLQYSLEPTNPFACILSGTASGFLSLSSSSYKTLDNARTIFGNTYNYLQDSEASDNAQSFDIEFVDTKHLDVFNFFKAYNEYHIARKSGLITPPTLDYYRFRRLHNTMGVYKFIVDEDMSTILYWTYFWGVIPTSYPRDAFSDPTFNDGLTFSINFEAAFIDDLNPTILGNFNYLMGLKLLTHSNSFDNIYSNHNQQVKLNNFKKMSETQYRELMIGETDPIPILQNLLQHRKLSVTKDKYMPQFTFRDSSGALDQNQVIPNSHTTMIDGTLASGALVVPVNDPNTNNFSHYKLIWYA